MRTTAISAEIRRNPSDTQGPIGTSAAMRELLAAAARVAPSDATVLILGETGTGKELIARAVQRRSRRAAGPFVRVNCAAIPPGLIAAELFGHERGAFTGALQRRIGRFELAHGGTIFLDEVGELPVETQVALLRVLQERQIERVGGDGPIAVDVRVIAATNRDLRAAVAAGAFRADLYFRLDVFPLRVPPLRARGDDVVLLARWLVDTHARRIGKQFQAICPTTLAALRAYDWPGNVRELQNVIECAAILCDDDVFSLDEATRRRLRPAAPAPSRSTRAPSDTRRTPERAAAAAPSPRRRRSPPAPSVGPSPSAR